MQIHKGGMKCDDPEMDTVQTPKHLDRRLALLLKIQRLSLTVSRTMPHTIFPGGKLVTNPNRANRLKHL